MRFHLTLLLAAALAGCQSGAPEPERVPLTELSAEESAAPAPRIQAQLDSGNAAYRAKSYEAAKRHYVEAARQDPEAAAGWYGVYMAETALGNKAAADSAAARVDRIAPGIVAGHGTPHGPTTTAPRAKTQ